MAEDMAKAGGKLAEPMIRLHFHFPCEITWEEFECMAQEMHRRFSLREYGVTDVVCMRILQDNLQRYLEVVQSRNLQSNNHVTKFAQEGLTAWKEADSHG